MAKSFPSTSRDRPALVGAVVLLFLVLCFALSPLLNATPSARAKAVAGKPLFAGVNLATGGFAPERIPGVYGHDYRYPDAQTAAPFVAMGMNAFRLPVLWERLQPVALGPLDQTELARVDQSIAGLGGIAVVIVDLHNYARYRGEMLDGSDASAARLADVWQRLAMHYRQSPRIAFGLMNEPHDIGGAQWRRTVDRTVAAIRATGSTNLLLVPGVRWSGGHAWRDGGAESSAVALHGFKDPANHFLFEIHQYLDSNSSGTGNECVDVGIGRRRLAGVTDWLRAERAGAVLGEFGASPNPRCLAALDDLLGFLDANADVWRGWTYWAGGDWWGDYSYSIQPDYHGPKPQAAVLRRHLADYARMAGPLRR